MDKGQIIADGKPERVGEELKQNHHRMFAAMPSPMQIYAAVENDLTCPVTVRDGRNWLSELLKENPVQLDRITTIKETNTTEEITEKQAAIACKEIWFKYEKDLPDVITGLNMKVPRASLYAVVGGNGTGKSTMLTLISGINKPYRGKIYIEGKAIEKYKGNELYKNNLAVLPQNPQSLFVKKTIKEDLMEIINSQGLSKEEEEKKLVGISKLTEIESLLEMHPFDVSGGEQQRAALAKVLLLNPKILLLDEPTKGIDNDFKNKLAQILKNLTQKEVTVLMVSHDIEYCARHADICSMFFNGNVVTTNSPNKFFSGNSFYTTAANRMSRHIYKNAVTNEDVISLSRQNLNQPEKQKQPEGDR